MNQIPTAEPNPYRRIKSLQMNQILTDESSPYMKSKSGLPIRTKRFVTHPLMYLRGSIRPI